jgi:hypothetical protein
MLYTLKTVTFDSTAKPDDPVVLAAIAAGWHVAFASVSVREAQGADFKVSLKKHDRVPELAVWDESPWDEARWADEPSSERLEKILAIVSNGGFPRNRSQLTERQLHQLRDAMILEAHVAAGRAVFVTGDAKAFIRNGRREQLESLLNTRIVIPSEFGAELRAINVNSV